MVSIPRHMVHDAQASLTAPLSISTSMRRWPSILVIGSTVIRLVIGSYLSLEFFLLNPLLQTGWRGSHRPGNSLTFSTVALPSRTTAGWEPEESPAPSPRT